MKNNYVVVIGVGPSISDAAALRFYRANRAVHFPIEPQFESFNEPTILVEEPKKMKQRGIDLLNRKR